ncbi:MAG: SusC/RagA family TonB-linked outer membrane protein, partial [Sphingobacteriales bacterium]
MLLLCQAVPIVAQSQTNITGTITFQNQPLPGATIAVRDKEQATASDEAGKYTITAASNDVLVISFMGMQALAIPVDGRSTINVDLKEDPTALKEVTVNAGYYSVKEKERTGSIAKISSKDIEHQPVTNVLATMAGRMAGVEIIQDSGIPGAGFQIKVRGTNSLRVDGNQPLYIVDGVPYSSESIGYRETSRFMGNETSPLSSINPSDIESVEVLKDADATAIYGSRGANGVVLITTKKGRAGKTAVTASASTAFGSVTSFLDLMDTQQYLKMREQAFANDGYATLPDYAYDVNGTWSRTRYTDWQKVLIGGTSRIQSAQLSLSGGSANTKYMLSGTYRTETTVMPGNYMYKKGGAHFSLDHKDDGGKFRVQFSADYSAQENDQPGVDLTAVSRTL